MFFFEKKNQKTFLTPQRHGPVKPPPVIASKAKQSRDAAPDLDRSPQPHRQHTSLPDIRPPLLPLATHPILVRRKHYRVLNELKQECHMAVLDAQPPAWTGTFPVDLRFVYRPHGKPLDSTNAVFMGKTLEDALVDYGVIPNEDPRYVRWSWHMTEQGDEDVV